MGGVGRVGGRTFFMFSARTSYSSKTSCSSGESSGGSESVFIVDSIADGPAPSLVFSYAVGAVPWRVPTRRGLMTPPFSGAGLELGWAGVGRLPTGS